MFRLQLRSNKEAEEESVEEIPGHRRTTKNYPVASASAADIWSTPGTARRKLATGTPASAVRARWFRVFWDYFFEGVTLVNGAGPFTSYTIANDCQAAQVSGTRVLR